MVCVSRDSKCFDSSPSSLPSIPLASHSLDCPYAFEESLKTYFGSSFPVFTTIGNHDQPHYPEYSAVIAERLTNAHIDTCVGEAGRQAVCTFKGIVLVLTTPGIFESGSDATHVGDTVIAPYINATLLENRSPWLVCSWHKNQAKMQTGGKIDETGWGVYDTCRERGAMIATGHEVSGDTHMQRMLWRRRRRRCSGCTACSTDICLMPFVSCVSSSSSFSIPTLVRI